MMPYFQIIRIESTNKNKDTIKLKIYCFDIDGVICKTTKSRYKFSKPNKEVINLINHLYKKYNLRLYVNIWEEQITIKVLAKNCGKKLTISQLKK